MSNFFDAVFLSRYTHQKGADIIKFYPNDFDFLNQKNIFSICSFPEIQADSFFQNNESSTPTTIYATTVEDTNCYVLSFIYTRQDKKEPNSIAILSHKMIAPEIFKILLDTRAYLFELIKDEKKKKAHFKSNIKSQNESDEINFIPELVLEKVWDCVQSCTFDYKESIFSVFTPIRKFKTFLGNEHFTFSQFDPNFWLSSEINLYVIWRALMTNRGILIIGESPAQVSCAVFSIISLAAPLKYCDPYISYTRLGDPRFAEIVSNQSRKWKIVGTTNSLLAEQCKQFAVIGKLPSMKGDEKYKEIDPDFLQQKFLNSTKTIENYKHTNRNSNHKNSGFFFNLKKLKNFTNNINSLFSIQLNEIDLSDHSQSSFPSSSENLSRSMRCNSLQKATNKMMTLIEYRLNSKIEYDPYFDVLSTNLSEEDFYGIFIPSSRSNKYQDSSEKSSKNEENPLQNNEVINGEEEDDFLNSNVDFFDIDDINVDDINNINVDDIDSNEVNEIDVDAISNEFLMRSKRLMKPKSLFNSNVPPLKASNISSFYLKRNKKMRPKIRFFTTKDAVRFKDSLTFKDWRKNITYRSYFRECFLSMTPDEALRGRNHNEQIIIYKALVEVISPKYKRDLHMTTVINRHICIVRKLLGLDKEIKIDNK